MQKKTTFKQYIMLGIRSCNWTSSHSMQLGLFYNLQNGHQQQQGKHDMC